MLHTGIVKKIVTRPWNGKTFYSLALTNTDGLFGFGLHNPRVNEGDEVEFEANKNDKGYWEAKGGSLNIKAKGSEGTHQNASAGSVGASKGVMPKDDYWGRKEARDLKQDELREIGATRNTAIEFLKILLDKEALKLPTKVAERESFLFDLLEDYVNKFRGIAPSVEEAPVKAAKAAKPAREVSDGGEDEDAETWN